MALTTRKSAATDIDRVKQDTRDHVFISWMAQGGIAPLVVTGGEGSWIHAGDRRILDFSSTLVNTNLGHQHPKVIRAIQEQAERLTYAAPGFTDEPRATLARMIAEVAPGDLTKTLFTTGGSEAVENAIKMARLYTGRQKVLTQWRSFHGQTAGAMTAGGDNRRWANEPGIPGVVRFLNPDPYRSSSAPSTMPNPPGTSACRRPAIMCEPIVGASGLIVPPDGFFQGIRAICDRYGIVMILDEVMTGFGRTGKWFAAEHWNVVPDVMTFAKGVNSGYVPLGGTIVDGPIAKHFDDHVLWHGLTYSGHALACAAGVATIQAYKDERVVEHAAAMGEVLGRGLRDLMAKHPSVGDVRGKGLMWGVELVKDRGTKEMLERWNGPSQRLATAIRTSLMKRDVYMICRWNLLVVAPPLVVTEDELRTGLAAMDEALAIADKYAATGEL